MKTCICIYKHIEYTANGRLSMDIYRHIYMDIQRQIIRSLREYDRCKFNAIIKDVGLSIYTHLYIYIYIYVYVYIYMYMGV